MGQLYFKKAGKSRTKKLQKTIWPWKCDFSPSTFAGQPHWLDGGSCMDALATTIFSQVSLELQPLWLRTGAQSWRTATQDHSGDGGCGDGQQPGAGAGASRAPPFITWEDACGEKNARHVGHQVLEKGGAWSLGWNQGSSSPCMEPLPHPKCWPQVPPTGGADDAWADAEDLTEEDCAVRSVPGSYGSGHGWGACLWPVAAVFSWWPWHHQWSRWVDWLPSSTSLKQSGWSLPCSLTAADFMNYLSSLSLSWLLTRTPERVLQSWGSWHCRPKTWRRHLCVFKPHSFQDVDVRPTRWCWTHPAWGLWSTHRRCWHQEFCSCVIGAGREYNTEECLRSPERDGGGWLPLFLPPF